MIHRTTWFVSEGDGSTVNISICCSVWIISTTSIAKFCCTKTWWFKSLAIWSRPWSISKFSPIKSWTSSRIRRISAICICGWPIGIRPRKSTRNWLTETRKIRCTTRNWSRQSDWLPKVRLLTFMGSMQRSFLGRCLQKGAFPSSMPSALAVLCKLF